MGILCTKNVTVSCLLVTGHLFDAVVVTSFGKKDAPSSLSAGSEINFLIRAPTGEQV